MVSSDHTPHTSKSEPLRTYATFTHIIYLIADASRPCPNVYKSSSLQCFDRFFEENNLGWTRDDAKTFGNRFVDVMSKAFFECTPSTWTTLNDKHNVGEFTFDI